MKLKVGMSPTATPAANGGFRFLDLPAEIQNRIYELDLRNHVFQKPTCNLYGFIHQSVRACLFRQDEEGTVMVNTLDPCPRGHYTPWMVFNDAFDQNQLTREPPLLSVCKQIRRDARSLYFQEHLSFSLDDVEFDRIESVEAWVRFHAQVDNTLILSIRKLQIDLSRISYEVDEEMKKSLWTLRHETIYITIERDADGSSLRIVAPCDVQERDRKLLQWKVMDMTSRSCKLSGWDMLTLAVWLHDGSGEMINGVKAEFLCGYGNKDGMIELDNASRLHDGSKTKAFEIDVDTMKRVKDIAEGVSILQSSSCERWPGPSDDVEYQRWSEGFDLSEGALWMTAIPALADCELVPGTKGTYRLHGKTQKTLASIGHWRS